MSLISRISNTQKIIRQLGLTQVTLYAVYKLGLISGYYKSLESRELETSHPLSTHLFSLPARDQLNTILSEDDQHNLIAQADEIVAGKFRMFGGEPVELKLTFDQPLRHWTDYETNPQLLATLSSPISDIKFIWEPARFGWAYTLGRAYHLSQHDSYAESFWTYFEHFTESNPANMGPHWMNGQEVALRLMAFVWANQVFETAAASSEERRARLAASVAEHTTRIPPTLLYARAQNNNHLVTEAAALYMAGLALPEHPQASRWRALGWRWLNWAFRNQISESGEYIQHSTNYHRVMLQAALWVNAIKDREWPRESQKSLERATHWLFSKLSDQTPAPTKMTTHPKNRLESAGPRKSVPRPARLGESR